MCSVVLALWVGIGVPWVDIGVHLHVALWVDIGVQWVDIGVHLHIALWVDIGVQCARRCFEALWTQGKSTFSLASFCMAS